MCNSYVDGIPKPKMSKFERLESVLLSIRDRLDGIERSITTKPEQRGKVVADTGPEVSEFDRCTLCGNVQAVSRWKTDVMSWICNFKITFDKPVCRGCAYLIIKKAVGEC